MVGLANVFWIGGSTDSGKTSVARAVAKRHGWRTYHYDLFDRTTPPGHWGRIDPRRHPSMAGTEVRDRNAMWVDTTAAKLFQEFLRTTPERFEMVLEDLGKLGHQSVVAEGYGFLPELVDPHLTSANRAVWLVSTREFKLASYGRRRKNFQDTRDPERARRNHIGRDFLIADHVLSQARGRGLKVITVGGNRPLTAVVDEVDQHFLMSCRG